MSTVQEQQHLAEPKASSRVGSHSVAHGILCSRQLTPVHISVPRRSSLIHLAASPQHTWAALIPASVPVVMCALR